MYFGKEDFLKLFDQIKRPGVENLRTFLESSDFFTAPASLRLYRDHEGGLCEQALARYCYMQKMNEANEWGLDNESLLITGLLADLDKVNYFEPSIQNKKHYTAKGSKRDDMGTFNWVQEKGWKIKDPEERFIFGTSGQNAERLITDYIPLKEEESVAILQMGVTYENPTFNYSYIYKKYPLACILNAANSLATFITEVPF